MTDLHRTLADQAEALLLPAGDAAVVARRAARRRARRRTATVAGAAAVAVLAVSVATRDGTDRIDAEGVAAATVAPSPLTWSVAEPGTGLGWEHWEMEAAAADGLHYRLSTAPGGTPEPDAGAATLYQSADGIEWELAAVPDELRPRAVSAGAGAAYVVGTVPSGGGEGLAVARVGADEPLRVELPAELAAVLEAHPDVVELTGLDVAALDDERLLVTTTVRARLDLEEVLPGLAAHGLVWDADVDGVLVSEPEQLELRRSTEGCGDQAASEEAAAEQAARGCPDRAGGEPSSGSGPLSADEVPEGLLGRHSWEDLGVAPEVAALAARPVTVLLRSEDGRTFEPVQAPAAADRLEVSAADGVFHLLATTGPTGALFASTDGSTWEPLGTVDGDVQWLASLDGGPVVVVWGQRGYEVLGYRPGSGVAPIDLLAAVADPDASLGEVAVGPLGIAGYVYPPDGTGNGTLVFSPDGTTVSAVDLDDVTAEPLTLQGLHVTADAVFVRAHERDAVDDDPATIVPQLVLVGTP